MNEPFNPVDFDRLRLIDIQHRQHKSDLRRIAALPAKGASVTEWLASLPDFLGASAFRSVVKAIVQAVHADRPVAAALGAHVIKVGCGPVIGDLVRRGVVRALACNGAVAIHDVELATLGQTSEEVADTIRDGSFGMVRQTLEFFAAATRRAAKDQRGLGAAICATLRELRPPHAEQSLLLTCAEAGIPVCVHVAIGTDTVHMAPGLSAEGLGAGAMRDFALVCDVVRNLGAKSADSAGGVWLNLGSAVLLPEVFLKAVSVARNLGADLDRMVTANFDMIRHYRPTQNVVMRPVMPGKGFEVIGQHEILLPLLRQAIIEQLD